MEHPIWHSLNGWPQKTAKAICILTEFWFKNFETSKNNSGGPKNPEIVQKLSIFDFSF